MIHPRVLKPRLAVVGRIKIGGLDPTIRESKSGTSWQAPTKFDYFVVTMEEKDQNNNFVKDTAFHSLHGVGEKPTELRVILLTNDEELNFRTSLGYYKGKTCMCRGDGETAEALDITTGEITKKECPCPLLEAEGDKPAKCKAHGVLSVVLADSQISGGVWLFSTTSWNTVNNISSSLKFLSACTGNKVAGVPLTLRYFKKQAVTASGKATTIGVVGLFYPGNTLQLVDHAIATEKKRMEARISLETVEAQIRRQNESIVEAEGDEDLHPAEAVESPTEEPSAEKPVEGAQNQGIAAALKARAKDVSGPPFPAGGVGGVDNGSATPEKPSEKPPEKPGNKLSGSSSVNAELPVSSPESTKPKPAFLIFGCEDCGMTCQQPGTLVVCGCGSRRVKKFNTLDEAETAVNHSSKKKGSSSDKEPVGSPDKMKAIVDEILTLRGSKKIISGQFSVLVGKSIGKIITDASKWDLAQAEKILAAVREYGGAA